MKKPHIVQILPMYHLDGEEALNKLADVKKFDDFNENQIIDYLKHNEVDGIILRAPGRITPKILDYCQGVKAISGAGVGLDNIHVDCATDKGIAILHAPKLNSQATAEHAVSLILAVMKKITLFDKETKNGNFSIRDGEYTLELKGKSLGLVGFGSIAQKVAKIMTLGFGMKPVAYVRNITEEKQQASEDCQVELTTSLESIFRNSDVVSLHIPLSKETNQIIDKSLLSLMRKTAVLINTARGGIVNEGHLIEALQREQILGAGIDVFTEEPPPKDHPFFQLNQVTVTPHIGGISLEAARETSVLIAENLIRAINGEDLAVIANKKALAEKERG